jgi:peptide/nickel transport system substrate-binding protein
MRCHESVPRPDGGLPKVKRFAVAGILIAGIALSLTAAGSPRGIKEGGTFRMGIPAEQIDSIDPALTAIAGTTALMRAICAGLMTTPDKPLPEGSRLVPDLAVGYPKITDGGKTYTFTLRKGRRFATGAPVTALDVAHTLNRILNPAMKAYAAGSFADIVGARAVLAGKATSASGIVARGRSLTIRLTRPVGAFTARVGLAACVLPRTVAADPEGAKAPIPTAGPYYVSEYVPGQTVVLLRNRFYSGSRPHHLDRIEVDLTGDSASVIDQVDRGALDYGWVPTGDYADRAVELRQKYGLNRSRFFGAPASFLRYFVLNTSRPLFRNNAELRRAVNFAVDRRALLRERGPLAGTLTDQYLPPGLPGFQNARIYPLNGPDVARARQLARGRTRNGRAVLYTPSTPLGLSQAQVVKTDLKKIGLDVQIRGIPVTLYFDKLATPGEPFDIAWAGWLADLPDPSLLDDLFDSRNIPEPNSARFDSPRYDALLRRASRLTGARRYAEYGKLDIDLARNAAPAIAYAYDNALTLVGPHTGCVVVNPYLDLASACLK